MISASRSPLPYRACVSRGSVVFAETNRAIRIDRPDAAPQLWVPRPDVVSAALAAATPGSWHEGEGDLSGHVVFDHDEFDISITDGRTGDDPGDVTTKRFPNWGDSADLVDVLDVRADAEGRFVSQPRSDWRRPVVEGSQMLAQTIVAASRLAPDRRTVSASMVFTRAVDARAPYAIELEQLSGGRTFSALQARANQDDRICAAGTVLLDVTAPDLISHCEGPPEVAGPYDAVPYDMSVTGRDLRIVDGAYTGDPGAPVGPPELDAWVRFRTLPDDPLLHVALMAQFTGHMSIAAALRPHADFGQDQAHRTLSTAINAISLSVHRPIRADHWMLYHHRSTSAAAGMTHSECRVFDSEGSFLASFTVDAMVRAFADPSKSANARTAL